MSNNSLAKRYARALFSIGEEENTVEVLGQDLEDFALALGANEKELLSVLTTPIIEDSELLALIATLSEKMQLQQHTISFISLLVEKKRLAIFSDIASLYRDMADKKLGIIRAEVETAVELSEEEKKQVQLTLAEVNNVALDKLMVEYNVNPDLIGGIVSKVGDTLYDASIRSRLQDIKHSLLSS